MTGRALAAKMDFVPEGRFENSPAIYRWGCGEAKNRSPVGTTEIPGWQYESAVPTGLLAARILRKPSDESLGYYRLSLRDSRGARSCALQSGGVRLNTPCFSVRLHYRFVLATAGELVMKPPLGAMSVGSGRVPRTVAVLTIPSSFISDNGTRTVSELEVNVTGTLPSVLKLASISGVSFVAEL